MSEIDDGPLMSGKSDLHHSVREHIEQACSSSATLLLNGEQFDARANCDAIASFFAKKPPDCCLTQQMGSFLNKHAAERGFELRDGRLRLPMFSDVPFPTDPTWAENPVKDGYWEFKLHSLLVLQYLLAAHHMTDDKWYLATAQALTQDWIRKNTCEDPPSQYSWSDHSTAMRLENLLYAFEYTRGYDPSHEFISDLLHSIHLHASILAEDAFYVRHHNHGLDQSFRLYWAGAAIPEYADSVAWRELGKQRTIEELSFALSEEGVHVENSPAYHFRHLGIIARIRQIFSSYDENSLNSLIGERLPGALMFAAHILRPDGCQPILGDTQCRVVPGWRNWSTSFAGINELEYFLYSVTAGREGKKPLEVDHVFKGSGYAIFRDAWREADNFSQTVYLVFKSGFLSAGHRHEDDLSILLYGHGEDWLVDSGLYRYQRNDPIRQFVVSAPAHNLAVVDDVRQRRGSDGFAKSRIESFVIANEQASVTGSHELFRGFRARRTVNYFRPDRITIEDDIIPTDQRPHTYRLLFHVPTDKRIELCSSGAEIYSSYSPVILRIRPRQGEFTSVYSETGVCEPYHQGWISHRYTEIEQSTCVVFEARGRDFNSVVELEFVNTSPSIPPLSPSR